MQTLQDTLWRRIQQRLDQLELNCNANIGEAVAAGIEEIRDAELAAGVCSGNLKVFKNLYTHALLGASLKMLWVCRAA